MGAGSLRRRAAANTGAAGAIHRVGFFAGMPAPSEVELQLWGCVYLRLQPWDC
ncbi:diguanylate cyclase [Pseudomonas sp. BN505]|nr:diguanylate cyclase [Pseudomonas sp. BN605]MDH4860572.1 diguanylate cyclase [Pseudomonas sp. BN505]